MWTRTPRKDSGLWSPRLSVIHVWIVPLSIVSQDPSKKVSSDHASLVISTPIYAWSIIGSFMPLMCNITTESRWCGRHSPASFDIPSRWVELLPLLRSVLGHSFLSLVDIQFCTRARSFSTKLRSEWSIERNSMLSRVQSIPWRSCISTLQYLISRFVWTLRVFLHKIVSSIQVHMIFHSSSWKILWKMQNEITRPPVWLHLLQEDATRTMIHAQKKKKKRLHSST